MTLGCSLSVYFAGASEEPPADVPEQNKMFSYPLFVSPPPQSEYLPGNFI